MFFGKKIASVKFELSLSPDFFCAKDFVGSVDEIGLCLKDIGDSLIVMNNCFNHRYVSRSGYFSAKIQPDERPITKINLLVNVELESIDLIRFGRAIASANAHDKKDMFVFHGHIKDSELVVNIHHDQHGFYFEDRGRFIKAIEIMSAAKI